LHASHVGTCLPVAPNYKNPSHLLPADESLTNLRRR
jgi:hypothetical protein